MLQQTIALTFEYKYISLYLFKGYSRKCTYIVIFDLRFWFKLFEANVLLLLMNF